MSREWHISSLVVHGKPGRLEEISAQVESLPGVEIHGSGEQGKLVVTIEAPSESGIVDCIDRINRIDGILSTALIYHHSEDEDSLAEEIDLEEEPADETDSPRVY